ncbi:MAG TPA: DUF4358 domain-containing protein [Clostridia bacterium]|nr:DUF4358 domain-containing protein [Clostridia bacterium]
MNKRLLILMLALLLISGCTAPSRKTETIDIKAVYLAMEKTGALPDMIAVPEGMLLDFYGIDPAWCAEALCMVSADSLLADEVVLIRARDEAAAKRILPFLEGRMQAKAEEAQNYSPEQYAIIKQGKILSRGVEMALIVSPQVSRLVKLYQGE